MDEIEIRLDGLDGNVNAMYYANSDDLKASIKLAHEELDDMKKQVEAEKAGLN